MSPAPESDAARAARQGDEYLQEKALQALSDLVVEAADIVGQLVALGTR